MWVAYLSRVMPLLYPYNNLTVCYQHIKSSLPFYATICSARFCINNVWLYVQRHGLDKMSQTDAQEQAAQMIVKKLTAFRQGLSVHKPVTHKQLESAIEWVLAHSDPMDYVTIVSITNAIASLLLFSFSNEQSLQHLISQRLADMKQRGLVQSTRMEYDNHFQCEAWSSFNNSK
jgi:tRNA A37 N6-isopentenylltransferase MiaA